VEESFGGWIKRRRRELALTQQDLARAVHISLSALQKYETGDRRPTRAMAEQLATALALGAAEREQFLRLARGLTPLEPAAPVEEPVVELYPSGLPAPLTGLIGRDDDLARLVPRLLGPARLLTITGPGGVGKTRLSLALAARVAGRFADGPWFVELAALADAQFLADTIGRRLGLREQADQPLIELLLVYLRERELLLVLDNFEHLLAAAPVLARLLAAAPRLRIIVTSRVPLQLYGEYEYPLDPLATAQQGGSISPAAQLFAERAEAANPRFVLTDETMGIVATIVARLDGLPLAIELAAARTRLLAPATLLELLSHERLEVRGEELDRPDRHRTLRTAISWSYALLDPVEQQLLANLAIFEGGCSLTAIKAVVKDHERPLIDGLGRLVSASLVRSLIDEAGESRFVMLETVREFAREQLLLSRLYQQVCEGHGLYYSQLAQPGLRCSIENCLISGRRCAG
jgi:predicted ATPase/DNA-binding XRE family transcriptional regulator